MKMKTSICMMAAGVVWRMGSSSSQYRVKLTRD